MARSKPRKKQAMAPRRRATTERPAERAAKRSRPRTAVPARSKAAHAEPTGTAAAPPAPPSAPATLADVAEAELLKLARDVAVLRAAGAGLREVLAYVARAWCDGPLPRARSEAFAVRARDKTRALALAWAREQVRVGLEDIVERAREAGDVRDDVPAALTSWVLLAGCEAIGWDPPGEIDDRVGALLALIGGGAERR